MCRKKFTHKIAAALLSAALVVSWIPVNGPIIVNAAETEQAENAFSFGSSQTQLSPGTYTLPVALKNAGDISKDSMAASCVRDGRIVVNPDGSADITIGLQAVSVFGITAWASNWMIYSTDLNGEKEAATPSADADGNVDSITFRLPDNAMDGVYTDMFVSAMNTTMQAYFAFDYANAVLVGGQETGEKKTGSAKVEQFGGYDVHVAVSVLEGKIEALEIEGANFEGTYADFNKTKLQAAIDGLKLSYTGKSATDAKELEGIDAVSGATYSSDAIRLAVLDALGLEGSKEEITLPTQKLEKGTYQVDIAFYTDNVKHSLVEHDKAKAVIKADAEGNLTLTTAIISGTVKEPLYFYDFNGYYEGNDRNGTLKPAANVKKADTDYSDDVFGAEEQVVTEVSFPLEGDFAEIYSANASIYVPAMKNLTGDVGGVTFEQGRFSSDCFAKIYWDSLEKINVEETLEDGVYAVQGTMYKPDLKTKSMADSAFSHTMPMTVQDGKATLRMNFKAMEITGLNGYLGRLKYYGSGYQKDAYGAPTGTLKDVTVKSVQKYSDGAVISDDFGTDYPDIISFEVIPEALEDGIVPLQVFVPIMESITAGTGSQNVYLKLDLENMEKTAAEDPRFQDTDTAPENPSGQPTPQPVDKTALLAWIETADAEAARTDVTYTSETLGRLKAALANARATADKEDATAEEVQAQVTALSQAIKALEQQPKPNVPAIRKPAAPSRVKAASAAYNKIKLTWSAVSGANGYEVYQYNSSDKRYQRAATVTGTSYTWKSLKTGQSYKYKVRAYKTVNREKLYGAFSKAVSAKPALSKASGVKAANTKSKATLVSWKKVSGASGYLVYRSTKKNAGFKKVAASKKNKTVKYTDRKLKKGKTYYYKIRAYRTVNGKNVYAPYSNTVKVKIRK